ncbi:MULTISPECIES: PrsW family intramembrane metalloprotease [unclassified Streptomyces]|uniref:PrsW family intramembrane metalloprotease n=1 Tax=unclassified Streptomyces TaxID=2593676 RepID=UPI0001C18F77|nr:MULTISPECIES: PrsW family intramembrane metalloprotease [unclassified Streptomyces]MYR66296.1 PrsW family intramembrane metalloprotease [Streptomyces sp. SID4939]MYR99506.1 PrsW family intramembrane metalloprotease [Streptomyces sp. SID4940]MYT63344.1 PrsW family intramembrane metalloprotease [Streptomyces sp. SID8357]MYT85594.1 PrsW family intramembrane metalloprotease [Streptomyces sp. SID8360]MYW38855.1 PrsW family intramembrane metalloprotease [Streptomyces sp. SID1]
MYDGSAQHQQPAVPVLDEQRLDEFLGALPGRGHWRYRPRRVGMVWRSRAFRAGAVFTALALCGLVILALVREQTGTEGFLVGLGLAVLPVPLLMAAFRWLDRVDPGPWRNLLFAFAWGACAAALVAIVANTFATRWIATATADPASADTLGATVIAPVVEESAKAAAVLLIFLFRRREFGSLVDGIVVAGFTATGFAFTENILYLGNAFGEDQQLGTTGLASVTVGTFFVRVVMSPFAHPLFTVLTGIGFGLAALGGRRHRVRRLLFPLLGLVLAMGLHAAWNGSSALGGFGFYAVYGAVMVPCFGLLTWLAIWSRQRELRTLAAELPVYAAAGWLTPAEPLALSSMRARGTARDMARRWHSHPDPARGKQAARAVAEYESFATSLAVLRRRARHDGAEPDFAARERELLHHLWQRRGVAAPALTYAAQVTGRVRRPGPPVLPRQVPYGYAPPRQRPAPVPAPHRHYGGYNPYLHTDGAAPDPYGTPPG